MENKKMVIIEEKLKLFFEENGIEEYFLDLTSSENSAGLAMLNGNYSHVMERVIAAIATHAKQHLSANRRMVLAIMLIANLMDEEEFDTINCDGEISNNIENKKNEQ